MFLISGKFDITCCSFEISWNTIVIRWNVWEAFWPAFLLRRIEGKGDDWSKFSQRRGSWQKLNKKEIPCQIKQYRKIIKK
jgi:hypothetical protein